MTALPEGVHDSFTYTCLFCAGTVKVVASIRLPHACKGVDDLAQIIMTPESFDGGPASCGPNDVYAARTAAAILAAREAAWDEGFSAGEDVGNWYAAPVRQQPTHTNPYRSQA